MAFNLFGRKADPRPDMLYARCVQQARSEAFYTSYGVPDSVEGRFEMVVLHCGMVFRRLSQEAEERDLARDLSERFFTDMDRTLREMGIGDMGVPKRMKKIAQAFFGRIAAYDAALEKNDDDLEAALKRNIYESPDAQAAGRLAAYVRRSADMLRLADAGLIAEAKFVFPDPEGIEVHSKDRGR